MHLIYVDESGNTGSNLKDSQQPVFLLAALIVAEECWQDLENALEQAVGKFAGAVPTDSVEVHCADLRAGRGAFRKVSLRDRIKLRNAWLEIAKKHKTKLAFRLIEKKRFEKWVHSTLGTGVAINPHVAAFPLLARVVDEYLGSLKSRGLFISDENKEIVQDVEKFIKLLRGHAGSIRLTQIVEKGFFIDSRKSRVLQLCDVCALTMRKKEESRIFGLKPTAFDNDGACAIDGFIHRGNESFADVLAWLTEQKKK